jgi:hypothetical protein
MRLLFILLLTPIVRPEERLSYGGVFLLVGLTLSLLILFMWGMFAFPRRHIRRFTNPNYYREETIKRLRKLLPATGKSTEEIEEYLARVPPLGQ